MPSSLEQMWTFDSFLIIFSLVPPSVLQNYLTYQQWNMFDTTIWYQFDTLIWYKLYLLQKNYYWWKIDNNFATLTRGVNFLKLVTNFVIIFVIIVQELNLILIYLIKHQCHLYHDYYYLYAFLKIRKYLNFDLKLIPYFHLKLICEVSHKLYFLNSYLLFLIVFDFNFHIII